jgi:hypothetical protein
MQAVNYLTWLIALFPLLSALYLLIFKPAEPESQRRWTALGLLAAGLASLARFILSGQGACTFRSGPEGCLQAGLLALSVLLINGLTLYLSAARRSNRLPDYEFFALVNAAWAGTALSESWVVSLGCLSLTLIAISRWVWNRGGSVGIFVGRDDYKNDIGPKN